jgi:hypothetical protein
MSLAPRSSDLDLKMAEVAAAHQSLMVRDVVFSQLRMLKALIKCHQHKERIQIDSLRKKSIEYVFEGNRARDILAGSFFESELQKVEERLPQNIKDRIGSIQKFSLGYDNVDPHLLYLINRIDLICDIFVEVVYGDELPPDLASYYAKNSKFAKWVALSFFWVAAIIVLYQFTIGAP